MEMGLLVDFRKENVVDFLLLFSNKGEQVYTALKKLLSNIDLSFKKDTKTKISWTMNCEATINQIIRNYLNKNKKEQIVLRQILLKMDAINLLLKYLYSIQRKAKIKKIDIYEDFFEAPFVKQYLDRHGLDFPTKDVRCRRIPFLFNILESLGIINQTSNEIEILSFVIEKEVLRLNDISQLKELYGSDFLTENYYLSIEEI
jgi:hypothetical protein